MREVESSEPRSEEVERAVRSFLRSRLLPRSPCACAMSSTVGVRAHECAIRGKQPSSNRRGERVGAKSSRKLNTNRDITKWIRAGLMSRPAPSSLRRTTSRAPAEPVQLLRVVAVLQPSNCSDPTCCRHGAVSSAALIALARPQAARHDQHTSAGDGRPLRCTYADVCATSTISAHALWFRRGALPLLLLLLPDRDSSAVSKLSARADDGPICATGHQVQTAPSSAPDRRVDLDLALAHRRPRPRTRSTSGADSAAPLPARASASSPRLPPSRSPRRPPRGLGEREDPRAHRRFVPRCAWRCGRARGRSRLPASLNMASAA